MPPIENIEEKPAQNVAEAWPIYDTLCICNTFYGSESLQLGWFNTFVQFAQKETHSFFMQRTIGQIGLQYTNKATVDRVDFAYDAFSLGVQFFAPGVRTLGALVGGDINYRDNYSAHWWESELPQHCAVQLKVQQDIVAEGNAMMFSPGYGATGSGASFEHEEIPATGPNGAVNAYYPPVMNMSMTQGVPTLSNRMPFEDPIGIPRTGSMEVILTVSEYARDVLANMGAGVLATAPFNYLLTTAPGTNAEFPARYGIRVSLMGVRYVQQRAQYHA